MSLIDDHLPCPRLSRWVGDRLGAQGVAKVTIGTPPRRLLRFGASWSEPGPDEPLQGLLVLTELAPPTAGPCPAEVLGRLAPHATIIEVAALPRPGLLGWTRPLQRRAMVRSVAVDRLAVWLDAGLCRPEQWASWDPVDALITVGVWTAQA